MSGKGSGSGMQSTKTSNTNLHQSSSGNSGTQSNTNGIGNGGHHLQPPQRNHFNRHLAMNLENDMYYTVDFSDSQHSPLIH